MAYKNMNDIKRKNLGMQQVFPMHIFTQTLAKFTSDGFHGTDTLVLYSHSCFGQLKKVCIVAFW
jgi:hypothetical protein